MEVITTTWNYKEFLTFFLLYAASFDYKLTVEEKEFINSFTKNSDFSAVEELFNKCSDYEIVQTIMSYKDKYFQTDEQKENIFKDIKDLLLADKKFSLHEENMFRAMRELLFSLK